HGFGVPVQFLALPRARVPHPDDAVLTAGCEAAGVWAEGDRVDRNLMDEPGGHLMRLRVPQAHGAPATAVGTVAGQPASVRTVGYALQRHRLLANAEDFPARRDFPAGQRPSGGLGR